MAEKSAHMTDDEQQAQLSMLKKISSGFKILSMTMKGKNN